MTTYETISLMVMFSVFIVSLISLIVATVKAILGTKKIITLPYQRDDYH